MPLPIAGAVVARPRPRRRRRTRPRRRRPRPAAATSRPRAARARRPASTTHACRARGFAYFSQSLNERVARARAPEARARRARPPARGRSAPGSQPVADHRRDPGGGRHLGGDDLRAHPARAQRRRSCARSRSPSRSAGSRPRVDERAPRVRARVGRVEAVGVGQQDEQVGADEDRDLRGEEVVVAEGDLVGRRRVVLVDRPARRASRAASQRLARVEVVRRARSCRRTSAAPARSCTPRSRSSSS